MIVNNLRPYQKDVHDKIIKELKRSYKSLLVEAVTASGKSWIIAALAQTIHDISRKNILCLAPNVDLVKQNREKYLTTGEPASIYSASAGIKCLKHPVVFSTPLTAKKIPDSVLAKFALIVIDEAHQITDTIIEIINRTKAINKRLRVVGLTGTPFKLGRGYIYKEDENGVFLSEEKAKNPFFDKLVCRITALQLLEKKYITNLEVGEIGDCYEKVQHLLQSNGRFKNDDINRVFIGRGRKTAFIIGEIVVKTENCKGVMIFASTVQHAHEIMDSLPADNARMIGGDTNMRKVQREKIVNDFKNQRYKYLVNVATMTTGVDFTHVDCIAILRPTESASLFLQIIGRGLRLHENKKHCLLLDYAGNLEHFFPDGDIWNPKISTNFSSKEATFITVKCPTCNNHNEFTARENKEGYGYSEDGYFTDLEKNKLEIPSHYGRRCKAIVRAEDDFVQCSHRWNGKECPHCGEDNDIAARYCTKCRRELIDPNDKLRLDFQAFKKDPYQIQTDEVLDMTTVPSVSKNGNEVYRVQFVTPYRNFTIWIQKNPKYQSAMAITQMFLQATQGGYKAPQTVTYKKEANGFYTVCGFNKDIDELKEM